MEMTDSSSGKITRQGIMDEVQNLLVVPQGHILALPHKKWRLCAMEMEEDGQRSLKRFGRELQMDDDDVFKFLVSLKFYCCSMLMPTYHSTNPFYLWFHLLTD